MCQYLEIWGGCASISLQLRNRPGRHGLVESIGMRGVLRLQAPSRPAERNLITTLSPVGAGDKQNAHIFKTFVIFDIKDKILLLLISPGKKIVAETSEPAT